MQVRLVPQPAVASRPGSWTFGTRSGNQITGKRKTLNGRFATTPLEQTPTQHPPRFGQRDGVLSFHFDNDPGQRLKSRSDGCGFRCCCRPSRQAGEKPCIARCEWEVRYYKSKWQYIYKVSHFLKGEIVVVNSGFAALRRTHRTASTSLNCVSATLFTCTKRETTAGTKELCTAQAKRDYFPPHLLKAAKEKQKKTNKIRAGNEYLCFSCPPLFLENLAFFFPLETQSKSLEMTSLLLTMNSSRRRKQQCAI